MNDEIIKEALSYSLGSDLHEAWCEQELYSFFERAQQEYETVNNYGEAIRNACSNGDDRRNEVELDVPRLVGLETEASQCLKDFNVFKRLFNKGIIEVKRFTKRNLTYEEISKCGSNYKDGKENILRSFSEISAASQQDNLEAARVAINLVYDKIINGEPITPEEQEKMAAVIHDEWLKRNQWVFDPNDGKPELAVPYDQLLVEEQDKDKAQLGLAIAKVEAYVKGLINVDEICSQYGIESSSKKI